MSSMGFHNCTNHKAHQLDDCPYCRITELERLCKTEFEEMTDADYSAWEDVAGRAKIAELERHQEALYKALQTARQERVEAVKKFNDVTPFVDWPRYHKRMEARDE